MSEFFGSIYCWLEDFFGIELAEYLWGESSPEQLSNMFIGIGLTMLVISLIVAVCYYYIINHPRLNNWWGWLIFLGINAVINFVVGWQWVLKDYYAGLMVKKMQQPKRWLTFLSIQMTSLHLELPICLMLL